jgi:hypothetical protein
VGVAAVIAERGGEVDRPARHSTPMAKLPKAAMTCGAVPVRTREASSAKVTSRTWCSPFSIPQCPQQVGEPGGAGLLERQAGDRVDGRGVRRLRVLRVTWRT